MRILKYTVPPASEGRRLKYFVRGDMGVSYHQYSALKREGGLTLNGMPARANDILHAGDTVQAILPDDTGKGVLPEQGEVEIVYEDEDVLIINKPAPLACQASPKQPEGALENRLAARYGSNFVFRPLNRLDRGTSGLMAAAKNAHACQLLQRQLHTPGFSREYLAVVEGVFTGSGTVDAPIAKEDAATVRRVVNTGSGKPAVTHYTVLQNGNGRSLVHLRLETGRTHQIRVHMAHLGHPVCGDFLYGTELACLPGRFALHSFKISFSHPATGQPLVRECPLPRPLQALLQPQENE